MSEQQNGPNVALGELEVSGIVKIIDKDGNVKSELEIISIEIQEDKENANHNDAG